MAKVAILVALPRNEILLREEKGWSKVGEMAYLSEIRMTFMINYSLGALWQIKYLINKNGNDSLLIYWLNGQVAASSNLIITGEVHLWLYRTNSVVIASHVF